MNVLLIITDSLRQDHVSAYDAAAPWSGDQPPVQTPNMDRIANEGTLFERSYLTSYPTIPFRRDLTTGKISFPTEGWQPLAPEDPVLPELVDDHVSTSALIFDTPPLANGHFNYTRGFRGWNWIRGQHADKWVTDPIDVQLPGRAYKQKTLPMMKQYLLNESVRQTEKEWPCRATGFAAAEWLERNRDHDGFFLWVDTWDPHEPFGTPKHYLDRYLDPNDDQGIIYPRYGRDDFLTERDKAEVRARYAAIVEMVDRSVGSMLDALDATGLAETTLVIHTSDHGHLFAEHGLQGQPSGVLGKLYEASIRTPLSILHPKGIGAGRRVTAIVQTPDIAATALDFLGVAPPEKHEGMSLLPLMDGADGGREAAFSGRFSTGVGGNAAIGFDGFAGIQTLEPLTMTTETWTLIWPPVGSSTPELYHLVDDPHQLRNVLDDNKDVAADLHAKLVQFLRAHDMDPDRLAAYQEFRTNRGDLAAEASDFEVHACTIDGRTYAFSDPDDALACAEGVPVRKAQASSLVGQEPPAMICVNAQYYYAEDLFHTLAAGGTK